jgi:hypothetical protein
MTLPLSTDYVLDFSSTDFESDSKTAVRFFSELVRGYFPDSDEKTNEMFGLSQPEFVAGWYFAKLYLKSEFVRKIHDRNSYEFGLIDPNQKPKVRGKVYTGDPFLVVLSTWINSKLKEQGCNAEVKIGYEMADFAKGTPGSAIGGSMM